MRTPVTTLAISLLLGTLSTVSSAIETTNTDTCTGYGPQSPRDIDSLSGDNRRLFSLAPDYREMNLCNIHFHAHAEHKAKAFSIVANKGGDNRGYQCNISTTLTKQELSSPGKNYCKGIKPGDTIEMHWVYTSCATTPGKGLSSCLSNTCTTPDLRVETQVFTVVNDPSALNFNELSYQGNRVNGYHQAKSLPSNTGQPVRYLGSTTGSSYSEQKCSPFQVSWSVRPQCAKLDINSLSRWCKDNVFEEDHAHGVRKLVIKPKLLSEISYSRDIN